MKNNNKEYKSVIICKMVDGTLNMINSEYKTDDIKEIVITDFLDNLTGTGKTFRPVNS